MNENNIDLTTVGAILGFLDVESLAQVVRETFITWAKEQPNPKPYWLEDWKTIQSTQPEQVYLDTKIAQAVAEETIKQLMQGVGLI